MSRLRNSNLSQYKGGKSLLQILLPLQIKLLLSYVPPSLCPSPCTHASMVLTSWQEYNVQAAFSHFLVRPELLPLLPVSTVTICHGCEAGLQGADPTFC